MSNKIRWAPRVPMAWIQRLYEQDADGIVDDELIDKVGYRLYERCRDSALVSATAMGTMCCPECRKPMPRSDELLCPACGWSMPYTDFHASWRHHELFAAGATHIFEEFIAAWDRARTLKEKMLAIDRVIHMWHWENRDEKPGAIGRPTGVNLIEGSRKQVIAFLDRLSGTGANKDRWQENLAKVREAQQR